jgi:ABC-2 type transport system ATP-binding protein
LTTPSNLAIHIEGLSKTYKTGFWFKPKVTHALNNLTLDVYEKEAFGLLGLNGAGKTTAIKIILGFLAPSAGSVQVLGGKISDREVRHQIGYLSELPYFSRQHTGRELLEYFGSLHGFSGSMLQKRVDEVLELVRMTKASREKVSGYSKGMLQRIGIGQALIGKPKLLICDEPMSGLDPVGYKEMRDIFIDLKKMGTTLFLNTHIMDEVERVCDRIGILHGGQLREVASVSDILQSSVHVDYWVDVDSQDASKLAGTPIQKSVSENSGVQIKGSDLSETLNLLNQRQIKTKGIRPLSSVMEAYFLKSIAGQSNIESGRASK